MKCWFYLSHLDMWVPLYVPISGDDPWPQFPKLKDCKAELIQDILGNNVPETQVKLYRCELTNRPPKTWDGELDQEWFVNEKWGLYVDADLESGLRECDFEVNERQHEYDKDNYAKADNYTKAYNYDDRWECGYKSGYDDGWQSGYKMCHVMEHSTSAGSSDIKIPVSPLASAQEDPAGGSASSWLEVDKGAGDPK